MTSDILLVPDAEAVSLRAAMIFTDEANIAFAARGRFAVALSGGTTPLPLFALLGTAYKKDIAWDHTDIFWADERCVPPDHQDSNFRGAYDAMLGRLDMPEANLHRIRGEMSPEEGAAEYEKELKRYFGKSGLPMFDLVILGVGEDGHTASLFPGSSSLSERERWAVPVYAEHLRSWRVTLTLPVLNCASHILFLVSGWNKAGVVKDILGNGENGQKYPADLIQPAQGRVTWLMDKEASSLLER
jgi:6-phosphogluconolactonase